jgi:hypothetical protein
MRRRALLAGLAAGSALGGAGCLSAPRGQVTDSPTATATASATPREVEGTLDDATATPVDGTPRTVSVMALDDAELRSAYDVAASATVTGPRVTTEHTATVRVTLANHGGRDRTLTYVAEECSRNMLFGSRVDGEGNVVLVPADSEWTRERERCWRARDRYVSCGIPAGPKDVDLPAGERVIWQFALWATGGGPCMPPGRYRFERAFTAKGRTPAPDAPSLTVSLAVAVPDA